MKIEHEPFQVPKLHVIDEGHGIPLVFMHGWAASHRFWKGQITYFAQKHRVITYDLRGHGDSEKPESGYSIKDHVQDLERVLSEKQVSRPVLIGHSLGGMIALQYTHNQSNTPRALVLVGTSPHPVASLKRSIQFSFLRFLIRLSRTQAAKFTKNALFSPDVNPDLVEWVNAESLRTPTHVILQILKDVKQFNIIPQLSDISLPILILNGEYESAIEPSMITQMQELLPQAQLQVISGAGHNCMLEQPTEFNTIMNSFLQKLGE